jgi:glycine/D-amino acid oxidase-like deaminating enzyme
MRTHPLKRSSSAAFYAGPPAKRSEDDANCGLIQGLFKCLSKACWGTLQWWTRPVRIETRRVGSYVVINSTEKAAEYLLEQWPEEENGKSFDAARQALISAHEGTISPEEARHAFLAAAEEAGIFFFVE